MATSTTYTPQTTSAHPTPHNIDITRNPQPVNRHEVTNPQRKSQFNQLSYKPNTFPATTSESLGLEIDRSEPEAQAETEKPKRSGNAGPDGGGWG